MKHNDIKFIGNNKEYYNRNLFALRGILYGYITAMLTSDIVKMKYYILYSQQA